MVTYNIKKIPMERCINHCFNFFLFFEQSNLFMITPKIIFFYIVATIPSSKNVQVYVFSVTNVNIQY